MKIRRKGLLVFTLSLCMLAGCQGKEETKLSVDSGVVKKEENKADSQNSSDQKNTTDDTDLVILPLEQNPISETNIKSLGDVIEWSSLDGSEMNFKVISVEFSKTFQGKDFGDYEKGTIQTLGMETDDKGNISNDYTYIWMKLQAENRAETCRWTPAQFSVLGINEDLTLEDAGIPFCYLDGMQNEDNKKDAFFVTFESGEKKEFLLGFAMPDQLKNKKWGYYISPYNDCSTPDKNSFIVQLN
ncbi:MAG: hypothetical protein PHG16_03935 [Lachnospiraceae bacterium]|nr:hypothetical protein [Lachnospiraceae bacterium]